MSSETISGIVIAVVAGLILWFLTRVLPRHAPRLIRETRQSLADSRNRRRLSQMERAKAERRSWVLRRAEVIGEPVAVELGRATRWEPWQVRWSDGHISYHFDGNRQRYEDALRLQSVPPTAAFLSHAPKPLGDWSIEEMDEWLTEHRHHLTESSSQVWDS